MRKENTKNQNIKVILTSFSLGFVFVGLALKFMTSKLPDKENTVSITGILDHDIELHGRKSKTFIINLKNHPDINFQIGSVSLKQTYSDDLTTENKTGDTMIIIIEDAEYRSKILKKEKIPFPDNILHYDKVDVVEIRNKTKTYLSLEDYVTAHRQSNYIGIAFFGIFGLILISAGTVILISIRNSK